MTRRQAAVWLKVIVVALAVVLLVARIVRAYGVSTDGVENMALPLLLLATLMDLAAHLGA